MSQIIRRSSRSAPIAAQRDPETRALVSEVLAFVREEINSLADSVENALTSTTSESSALQANVSFLLEQVNKQDTSITSQLSAALQRIALLENDLATERAQRVSSDTNQLALYTAQSIEITGKQPLDSTLTALSGLTTTTFGRSLLTLRLASSLAANHTH